MAVRKTLLSICLAHILGGLYAPAARAQTKDITSLVTVRIGTVQPASHDLHFSPDGRYLFTGTPPIWSLPSLKKVTGFGLPQNGQFRSPLALPPPVYDRHMRFAATTVWYSGWEETMLWSIPGWKKLLAAPLTGVDERRAISADGRYFAACSRAGLQFWSLPDVKLIKTLPLGVLGSRYHPDSFFEFSPSLPVLAVQGSMTPEERKRLGKVNGASKVSLWSVPQGKLVATILDTVGIGFSPDGRTLACSSSPRGKAKQAKGKQAKGGVQLWSVPEGKRVASFGEDEPRGRGALSPDGRYVAYGGGKSTRVWSVQDQKLLTTIGSARFPTELSFSPDGRILATLEGGNCRLWSVPHGKPLTTLADRAYRIAFSPDGHTLVCGQLDAPTSVWLYAPGDGLDFSRDKAIAGRKPRAEAKLSTTSVYAGDKVWLDLTVRNSGDADLVQLWAGPDAESLQLRQLTTLMGRVKAGATIQRRIGVVLPAEHQTGKIKATLIFREGEKKGNAPAALPFVVEVKPLPRPDFTLLAKPAELQLKRGQELVVPIALKNQTGAAITDLRVTVGVLKDDGRVMLNPATLDFGTVGNDTQAERRVAIQAKNDVVAGPATFELRAGDSEGRVFAVQQFVLPVKE